VLAQPHDGDGGNNEDDKAHSQLLERPHPEQGTQEDEPDAGRNYNPASRRWH
jgi:hypothetical protein